jgi:hypothetical protein
MNSMARAGSLRLTLGFAALVGLAAPAVAVAQPAAARVINRHDCASGAILCTEVADSEQVFGKGVYVGHDEPSLLFYSDRPGAGNDNTYFVRLPKDPPVQPKQDGSGGTFNFQLHPALWVGMALCDDQSSPAPGQNATCRPDSDANIYNAADPASPRYIGKHPGTAFMEMQFYPPSWVPQPANTSCDARKWCAAMTIDSLSLDFNHNVANNPACLAAAGLEPVNFAFITKNGRSTTAANPTNNDRFNLDPQRDLFMNSGDLLAVHLFDTRDGFRVDIVDLTTHEHGSMTASTGNGFSQVLFQPNATTCGTVPSAFHPEYSTSSEQTRVPWAAHSYNTAFSDEIGHFENCAAADPNTGLCTKSAGQEPIDADDNACFNPSDSTLIRIAGCLGQDNDFDGVPYQNTWPGTGNPAADRALKPEPFMFTSPLVNGSDQVDRVAFETDLPRIEDNPTLVPRCNRTTGANCTNPPTGARFYPIFSTTQIAGACAWQLGGPAIPGTTNNFGGTSTAEYGDLLSNVYPGPNNQPRFVINDFRRILPDNPCQLGAADTATLSSTR